VVGLFGSSHIDSVLLVNDLKIHGHEVAVTEIPVFKQVKAITTVWPIEAIEPSI
jgi:hypothetical protein